MKSLKSLLTFALILSLNSVNLSAQWTKITAPTSTYPYSLAVTESAIYLGTLSNGMYRSTNEGQTWTEINTNIVNKTIWSVSIVENEIFVSTGSGGLYKSNNGDSWTAVNYGISSTAIIRSVAKFDNKYFAASNNQGVYVSTDNGASWTKNNTGISGLVVNALMTTDTDLFAAVLQAVYKFDTTTQSWTKTSTGIPNNTVSAFTYYKNDSLKKLYACVSNYVCKSENNGSNWTAYQNGLPTVPIATIASVGSTLFVGNDYGVYKSTDFGENWTNESTGFTNASYATFLNKNSSNLYVLQGAALWKRSFSDLGITATKNIKFNNFELYPNPVKNKLYLKELPEKNYIEIYNLNGSLINTYKNINEINTENLVNGMYLIRIKTDTNIYTSKFEKLN